MVDDEHHPKAIITQQSLLIAIANTNDFDSLLEASCDLVTMPITTARDSMIIEDAITLINQEQAKNLVIIEESAQLCGLVTHSDFVNSYANMFVDTKENI